MILLTNQTKEILSEQLIRYEGMKLTPYLCSAGYLKIGVGRNLMNVGITKQEAVYLLHNDIDYLHQQLEKHLPWMSELPEHQKMVLINMAFNLGIEGLLEFKEMLVGFKTSDLDNVEDEILDSIWAEEVGSRANELVDQIRGL